MVMILPGLAIVNHHRVALTTNLSSRFGKEGSAAIACRVDVFLLYYHQLRVNKLLLMLQLMLWSRQEACIALLGEWLVGD